MQLFMKALAWTFVHSLWEGLLVALIAAIIISATRKTKASLRYNLLGITFLLFLVSGVITFMVQWQSIQPSGVVASTKDISINIIAGDSAVILQGGFINDLTHWFNNNTSLLLFIWIVLFSVNCLKLMTGLAAVNRLRNYRTQPVADEWKNKLEQFKDALGIRQSVKLLQSELIKVPVAIGYLKPVILLPVGLLANIPTEQVEAILMHELGHIRRKDYIINFLQHFIEAVFFFNPAVLWISSLLRQEREACCDDIVVAKTGQKRNYLDALVNSQEYSFTHTPYAMGFSSRRQYLLNRVKRIITNENTMLNLFEKTALFGSILLFSAFTYINKEEKMDKKMLAIATKQFIIPEQSLKFSIQKESTPPAIKREKQQFVYKAAMDTVPKKNMSLPVDQQQFPVGKDWTKPAEKEWTLPTEKEWDKGATDAKKTIDDQNLVLKEIEQIKAKMGLKKDSIGVTKEKLKLQERKNENAEQALKNQLGKERAELEIQRAELNRKREVLATIKKKNDDQIEKKNELKYEIKNEEKNEMKHGKINESKILDAKPDAINGKTGSATLHESIFHKQELDCKIKNLHVAAKAIDLKIEAIKLENSKLNYAADSIRQILFERKTQPKLVEKNQRVNLFKKPLSPLKPFSKENLKSPSSPGVRLAPIIKI